MSLLGSGLSLRIWYANSVQMDQWHYDNLAAPYWRCYWNDSPGWCVQLGGKQLELKPDYLVLIPPETPFSTTSRLRPRHHYIEFSLDGSFQQIPAQFFCLPIKDIGKEFHRQLLAHMEHSSIHNELLLHQDILRCLTFIPQAFIEQAAASSPVSKVMTFLQMHLDQRFDSAYLAAMAGVSADTFPRLFRKHCAEGLQAWHQRQRVNAVCFALHHGHATIDQIAEQFGFSDRYHLSKLFKKYRGIGPAQFRRQRYVQHLTV